MNYSMVHVLPSSPAHSGAAPRLSDLRQEIGRMERGRGVAVPPVMSLGLDALDHHLPFRGLALRRLHEVAAAGEREVQKALRKALLKYKLHTEQELFDRAYGYIRQYY